MEHLTESGPLEPAAVSAIVAPVRPDGTLPEAARAALARVDAALPDAAARLAAHGLERPAWLVRDGGPDVLLAVVGDDPAAFGALREAAMLAARAADVPVVASLLGHACPDAPAEAATVVAEGWALGAYRFEDYRSRPAPPAALQRLVLVDADPDGTAFGAALGHAATVARTLVDTPPGDLPPLALADRCRELGAAHGLHVRVREREELAHGGFGGLLAVGAGSANPPVLVEIDHTPVPGAPHVALVGKGVTYDAGGLSLKSNAGLQDMKADMAGAAAVLGALLVAARRGLRINLRGYLACAENLPDGAAMRVGDVVRHRNGLTTEVTDADCEGRLMLADVLAYAAEAQPALIVDLATLSSITGLGPSMWAGLGTAREAVAALVAAGAAAGEPGWELPLWDGYADRLRSRVADSRNLDPGFRFPPAAMIAALYLRPFAATVPWAHVDLGVSVMRPRGDRLWAEGANGNGTRTLARFLTAVAQDRPSWLAAPKAG